MVIPLRTERRIFILQDSNTFKSKRDAFICYYILLGSISEAAERAGFGKESALGDGIKLLKTEKCRSDIAKLREIISDSGNVIAGLKRLAFGSCSDAVCLAFADELPPKHILEKLDLFNVSEIKRDRGGGVEIKIFDRLKALEKLYELENSFSDRNKAADLIAALTSPAEDGETLDDK